MYFYHCNIIFLLIKSFILQNFFFIFDLVHFYFKGNYFNREIKEIVRDRGQMLANHWFTLIIIHVSIVCKRIFLNLHSLDYCETIILHKKLFTLYLHQNKP